VITCDDEKKEHAAISIQDVKFETPREDLYEREVKGTWIKN